MDGVFKGDTKGLVMSSNNRLGNVPYLGVNPQWINLRELGGRVMVSQEPEEGGGRGMEGQCGMALRENVSALNGSRTMRQD